MALDWQTVDIPLGAGEDTGIDPKLVQPGQMLEVTNGYQKRTGEIAKRPGYEILSNNKLISGTLGAATSIVGVGDSLLLFGDNERDVYAYMKGPGRWASVGNTKALELSTKKSLGGNAEAWTWIDAAYHSSGLILISFDETLGAGESLVVFDLETGDKIASKAASYAHCFYMSSLGGLLCAVRPSGNNLILERYYISTRAFAAPVTIATDFAGASTNPLIVEIKSEASDFMIAYEDTSNDLRVKTVYANGALHDAYTEAVTPDNLALGVCSDNADIFCAFQSGGAAGNVNVRRFNTSLVLQNSYTVIAPLAANQRFYPLSICADPEDSDGAVLVGSRRWSVTPAGATELDLWTTEVYQLDDTSGTLRTTIRHVSPSGHPFVYGSHVFFTTISLDESLRATGHMDSSVTHLLDWDGNIYARYHVDETGAYLPQWVSGATPASVIPLPHVCVSGSLRFWPVVQETADYAGITAAIPPTFRGNIKIVQADFAGGPVNAAPVGNSYLLPLGFPGVFDGKVLSISGFSHHPIRITASPEAVGSMDDGTYLVVAVYEWFDDKGNLYRSAVSSPVSVTTANGAASNHILVTYPNLNLVEKTTYVQITFYRTLAGLTAYYRVRTKISDPTAETSTVVLNEHDNDVSDEPLLYTEGGVQGNRTPPAGSFIAADSAHAYLVDALDRTQIWETKPLERITAPEFSGERKLYIPTGGDITALAIIDQQKIVFKERQIRAFYGEGANALGVGSYSQDYLIVAGVGCSEPNSVIQIPQGVIFKSHRGFYLLERNLSAKYIGRPVQEHDSSTVLAATLIDEAHQVRFLLSSEAILVWDYEREAWSEYDVSLGTGTHVDATFWDGKYVLLDNDGVVGKEDASFTDGAADVILKVRTPWIKLAGIVGFQRVRRFGLVGEFRSRHILTVNVYHDYDATTVVQTFAVNSSGLQTVINDPQLFRGRLSRQKCSAIMLEIYDGSLSGTGESLTLTAVAFEVGVKKGLRRLKPSATQ